MHEGSIPSWMPKGRRDGYLSVYLSIIYLSISIYLSIGRPFDPSTMAGNLAVLPFGTTEAQFRWLGHVWEHCSLIMYGSPLPNFGMRLHAFAALNPVIPAGPFAGEWVFNCPPLSDPNLGLPLAAHWPLLPPLPGAVSGCIDVLALIPIGTTLTTVGLAGDLARFISCGGASRGARADGRAWRGILAVIAAPLWPTWTRLPLWGAVAGPTQPAGQVVAGQVDIIFGITKGGFRCRAPGCNKPMCPWTLCPRDNCPFFSRWEHLWDHAGMRGLAGSNNILPGHVCGQCARQGRA